MTVAEQWNATSPYAEALWRFLAAQRSDDRPGARRHEAAGAFEPAAEPDQLIPLYGDEGVVLTLDVSRYAAPVDEVDAALLDRCTGPTLDIGCGPGRLAAELGRRGVMALGIDVTPVALLLARASGATVLCRSVFDRLPGEGRWHHALLIDGNIGIGGDPERLLRRIRTLLVDGLGELVVEVAPEDVDRRDRLGFGGSNRTIPWASLGQAALTATAAPLGFVLDDTWNTSDRCFVALRAR